MYTTIKKLSLSFIFLNVFTFQSLMADMIFYYNAAILPSIISQGSTSPSVGLVSENDGNDRDALISPNGGEIWTYGETQVVEWMTQFITGNTVNLYVLHDDPSGLFDKTSLTLGNVVNTKNWYKFATNVQNSGSYVVDPVDMNGIGDAYMVLVVSTTDNNKWDISDGTFTLANSVPVVDAFIDTDTGLQWADLNQTSGLSVSGGRTYCENLVIGQYSDWHLPTVDELEAIIDFDKWLAGGTSVKDGFRNITSLDTGYWSSSYIGDYYYYVNYYQGGHTKRDTFPTNGRNIICNRIVIP